MTKSNAEELIAVLWFLLATQTWGWVRGFAIGMGVVSTVAALLYAFAMRDKP